MFLMWKPIEYIKLLVKFPFLNLWNFHVMICRNLSLVDFIVIVGDIKFNFLRFIEFCVFVNISLRLIYFIIFLNFFRSIGSIMIRFLHFFFYLQIFVRADSCRVCFILSCLFCVSGILDSFLSNSSSFLYSWTPIFVFPIPSYLFWFSGFISLL